MTKDEVAMELGLRPFDDWALERFRHLCSEQRVKELGVRNTVEQLREGRDTGKTTELQCAALAAASDGQLVEVWMHRHQFQDLRRMASQLGIDQKLLQHRGGNHENENIRVEG